VRITRPHSSPSGTRFRLGLAGRVCAVVRPAEDHHHDYRCLVSPGSPLRMTTRSRILMRQFHLWLGLGLGGLLALLGATGSASSFT
jgi:hypothetical protein